MFLTVMCELRTKLPEHEEIRKITALPKHKQFAYVYAAMQAAPKADLLVTQDRDGQTYKLMKQAFDEVRYDTVFDLRRRLQEAEAALRKIKDSYGQVCPEFETCQHPWCTSSYSAWATADEYLTKHYPKQEAETVDDVEDDFV